MNYEALANNLFGLANGMNAPADKNAGGGGDDNAVAAPKGYKPSTNIQRKNWNSFLNFLEKKGVGGSPDLDKRDKTMGLEMLREYNKKFPDAAVPEEFIPTAQYENILIRKHRTFPGIPKEMADYAFNGLNQSYYDKALSSVDNWLGSQTSRQFYPEYRRGTKEGEVNFGTDFESFFNTLSEKPQSAGMVGMIPKVALNNEKLK